jgi:hypothetical protein
MGRSVQPHLSIQSIPPCRFYGQSFQFRRIQRITVRPEQHGRKTPLEGQNERVDPFPANFLIRRYLKDPPGLSFTDQGISIGQPFGTCNMKAYEAEHGRTAVLPNDPIGFHIHLNNPGTSLKRMAGTIVENQQIAVRCDGRIVLVAKAADSSPSPQDLSLRPGDFQDVIQFLRTQKDVSLGRQLNRIDVRPFVPKVQ